MPAQTVEIFQDFALVGLIYTGIDVAFQDGGMFKTVVHSETTLETLRVTAALIILITSFIRLWRILKATNKDKQDA